MSKSIKVSEDVYTRLQLFQGKRETFSEAIGRLLVLMEKMGELTDILEGSVKFREWEAKQREAEEKVARISSEKGGERHEKPVYHGQAID